MIFDRNILLIYFIITCFFWIGLLLTSCFNKIPKEIKNHYDYVFYGLFWVLIILKYMMKFLYNLFKT